MRRRHREIAGGEVAMMAVITKAMGAFLVLMILLLPYYTGDTKSQQTVDETRQRIDAAKAGLDSAVDKLKKGRLTDAEIDDLLKSLMLARDELVEAQNLIAQLRIKIDQMASQINRLEQQNAALQTQVAQLQSEMDALKVAVATLVAENLALKTTVADLTAKVTKLETENATLTQQNTELQAKLKDIEKQLEALSAENTVLKASIAELNAKVTKLETENASLTQENAALKAEIERLKAFDPETLKARIKELETQVADLTTKMTALEGVNATLTKQNTALSEENADLKKRGQFDPYAYVVSDCGGYPNLSVNFLLAEGTSGDDAYDDAYVASIMPWARRPVEPSLIPELHSDIKNMDAGGGSIPISEGTLTWDISLSLVLDDAQAKILANEANVTTLDSFGMGESATDSYGKVVSSKGLTSCKATLFIAWRDKVANYGTYQLGLVEPVIHISHVNFLTGGSLLSDAKDQRREMPKHVANAVCAHFPAFCFIAKRHAEWRIRGENPWFREDDDPAASPSSLPQLSTNGDTLTPTPKDGPPPPPITDKTITHSP